MRLQQIHVMPNAEDPECCPICEQKLNDPPPAVEQLRASLDALENQISSVDRDRPGLVAIEGELEVREAAIREQMEANRTALEAVAASAEAVEEHQAKLDLGAWVRGRIDHFLEKTTGVSDQGLSALDKEEERVRTEIGELEDLLDPARVRADAESVLIGVGRPMTEMARKLGLGHAESGVRVELNRLTVVADTPEGAIYMNSSIGSAKNWVGYHLATALSLQGHFVRQKRPVPSFLVLDQPSQAFFPAERSSEEMNDQDRDDALAQFELLRGVVNELEERLQVIVLDHADFDVDWFQGAVRQRWRDGEALIPTAWIDAGVKDSDQAITAKDKDDPEPGATAEA